jgi:hypothetical protein
VTVAFGLAACAGAVRSTLTRDEVQAMLNTELNTGDSTEAITSFFQRHDFSYTYDESLRCYTSHVSTGSKAPLAIYIYTDVDQKLTVAQVIAPPAQPRIARRTKSQDDAGFLDLNRGPRRF